MGIPIHVEAYSGFRANERPLRFTLDNETYEVVATIQGHWREPDAVHFTVLTSGGRRCRLRYDQQRDRWTLLSGLDGTDLIARPTIDLIVVTPEQGRAAARLIDGCERCSSEEAEIPLSWVLDRVTGRAGAETDYVLAESVKCPRCAAEVTEQALVEW